MPESSVKNPMNDARAVIDAVLPLNIDKRIKKNVINLMIWHISGSDVKEKTRYITEMAQKSSEADLIMAYINPLGNLAGKILENPLSFNAIMENIIPCTITKEELKLLNRIDKENPGIDGWMRFKKAQINVYDTEKAEFVNL